MALISIERGRRVILTREITHAENSNFQK